MIRSDFATAPIASKNLRGSYREYPSTASRKPAQDEPNTPTRDHLPHGIAVLGPFRSGDECTLRDDRPYDRYESYLDANISEMH